MNQIETTVDDIWDKEAQVNADEKLILSMKEAVLGESEQQKKLQVFIQKVSDVTKITDEGGWLLVPGSLRRAESIKR